MHGKPMRAIGLRVAEAGRCRLGGLRRTRRALLKEDVRCPQHQVALPCAAPEEGGEKKTAGAAGALCLRPGRRVGGIFMAD